MCVEFCLNPPVGLTLVCPRALKTSSKQSQNKLEHAHRIPNPHRFRFGKPLPPSRVHNTFELPSPAPWASHRASRAAHHVRPRPPGPPIAPHPSGIAKSRHCTPHSHHEHHQTASREAARRGGAQCTLASRALGSVNTFVLPLTPPPGPPTASLAPHITCAPVAPWATHRAHPSRNLTSLAAPRLLACCQ